MNIKQIDKQTAERAYHGTSFSPEKRGASFINDYEQACKNLEQELGNHWNQEVADKLYALYTDILAAQSRCMSTMITGPANFPVARNEKANRSLENKWQSLNSFIYTVKKRAEKQDNKASIEAAGGELAIAKAKLATLKKNQEKMKAANKIIRIAPKYVSTPEKLEALRAIGFPDPEKIFAPNCFGCIGFEGFELTNNNAKIKNTAARVSQLERREAAAEQNDREIRGAGLTVTICYADNRIRIAHDEIPSREVRSELKACGFHWSRQNTAWQRQLTRNAIQAAEQITKLAI